MNIAHLGGHNDIACEITWIPNNSIVFYVLFGIIWLSFFVVVFFAEERREREGESCYLAYFSTLRENKMFCSQIWMHILSQLKRTYIQNTLLLRRRCFAFLCFSLEKQLSEKS